MGQWSQKKLDFKNEQVYGLMLLKDFRTHPSAPPLQSRRLYDSYALFTNIQKKNCFFLIDVFHNYSNLALFQGVILKWHSENFGIYKTLTGAQKFARSPIDVPFGSA